jgi:hypothetical protein
MEAEAPESAHPCAVIPLTVFGWVWRSVVKGDRFTLPSSGEGIPAGHVLYPLVDRLSGPAEHSGAGRAILAFSAVPDSCIASGGREPAETD